METIKKYKLTELRLSIIEMPIGAKILTSKLQEFSFDTDSIVIWALCDDKIKNQFSSGMEKRYFETILTDQEIINIGGNHREYITTIESNGHEVHLFELSGHSIIDYIANFLKN